MMLDKLTLEKEVFLNAIAIKDLDARNAYLDKVCAGEQGLRRRVDALIHAHDTNSGPFNGEIQSTVQDLMDRLSDDPLREPPGTVIGPYTLLEQIGEGGMGIVYMAEQIRPMRRHVAIKLIKPGMDTRHVIARFEAERQALALMDHPNIAHIFDAGSNDSGRSYFVMELVRGMPITEYCDLERLDLPNRLRLFAKVCLAVQHAHQKGIIHRDLKPSNILVTVIDGEATPKIIDFGVAKALTGRLTDNTYHTGFHQFLGTPLYMSPEQAALSGADADTRSDIYSLGVLLYQILTGTTPIRQETVQKSSHDAIRRMVVDLDPPKPSSRLGALGDTLATISTNRSMLPRTLRKSLRGELDWIVMKALEKDRGRRYQSSGLFAADIERYLNGHPVEAGPPSSIYRFKKFAGRHKTLFTTASAIALTLVVTTSVSTWLAIRAIQAENRAEVSLAEATRQRIRAERHLHASLIQQADQALSLNETVRAQEILDEQRLGDSPYQFVQNYLWRKASPEIERLSDHHSGLLGPFEQSHDGALLACHTDEGYIGLFDTRTGQTRLRLKKDFDNDDYLAFSSDDSKLATAAFVDNPQRGIIWIWEISTGRVLNQIEIPLMSHHSFFRFSGGDRYLSVNMRRNASEVDEHLTFDLSQGGIAGKLIRDMKWEALLFVGLNGVFIHDQQHHRFALLDPSTGAAIWSLKLTPKDPARMGISGDKRRLGCSLGGRFVVLDAADARVLDQYPGTELAGYVRGVEINNNASRIAIVDWEGILLWDREKQETHRIKLTKPGRSEESFDTAFSPDSSLVAITASGDPGGQDPVWIHDFRSGKKVATFPDRLPRMGFTNNTFSRTTKALFLSTGLSVVRWYFEPREFETKLAGHAEEAWAVAFSPDGKILATGSDNTKPGDTIKLWDVETGKLLNGWRIPQGGVSSLAWSPDGKILASALFHPTENVKLWDVATGQCHASLKDHVGAVRSVVFSPDGQTIATAGDDKLIRLWDGATGKPTGTLAGNLNKILSLAFSPDGRTLASASNDYTVGVWKWTTDRMAKARLRNSTEEQLAVQFSPDGAMLAASDQIGNLTFWDTTTFARKHTISASSTELFAIAFTPDGSTIATAGMDGTIRLWDPLTGQKLLELKGHKAQINDLAFSPDGQTLASCSHDGVVKLWKSEPLLP